MTEPANPWLPVAEGEGPVPPRSVPRVATTGPDRPQDGVPIPDQVDQLPIRLQAVTADLWLVGAHGGSGESTIAGLGTAWRAAGHAWPGEDARGEVPAVVVARTHVRGLTAAKAVGKQWAAGLVPGVHLLGLALVRDAPGRLPKPLRDLAGVVAGGYPRVWMIPWVEAWRLGDELGTSAPREVRRLVSDLQTLLNTPSPHPQSTQRKA